MPSAITGVAPRTMPPGAGSSKGKDEANPLEHDEDVARSIALRFKQNRKRNRKRNNSDSDSDSSTDTPLKKRPKAKAAGKTKRKPRKPRQKPDPHYKSPLTPSQAREAAERGDFHTLALLEPSARMGKDGKPYVAKGNEFRDSGTKESLMPILPRSVMYDVFTEFIRAELRGIYGKDYNMDPLDYDKALKEGTAIAVMVDPTAIAEAHEKFGQRVVTVAKKTDGSVNPHDQVVSEDESDCSDFNPEDFGCYDTDCNDASDGSGDDGEGANVSGDEEEGNKHQDKDENEDSDDEEEEGED